MGWVDTTLFEKDFLCVLLPDVIPKIEEWEKKIIAHLGF